MEKQANQERPDACEEKEQASFDVATYDNAALVRENEKLKQQVLELQNKLLLSQEIALVSAKVIDTRISGHRDGGGRQVVEFKLQVDTDTRGTLYVWHRYSTFHALVKQLQTKSGYKRSEIPELPNTRSCRPPLSKERLQERVAQLNKFLYAATRAEHLPWGIRVDDETCVYKRQTKRAKRAQRKARDRESLTSTASTQATTATSENNLWETQPHHHSFWLHLLSKLRGSSKKPNTDMAKFKL